MSDLSVSVIIPAYNASRTIGRALDSLLSQTRRPDEIIVVDDGSRDELIAALVPYRNHVILVRKPNGGAASARNVGIDRSQCDLIAFLDADDFWEPRKLELQMSVFRTHPEVGLVAGRFMTQEPGFPTQPQAAKNLLLYGRVLPASPDTAFAVMEETWTGMVVVARSALGSHRFVSGLEPAEDRDLWIRLAAETSVYLIAEPLATWVLEPGSLSRTNLDRDCSNMLKVVHRHARFLTPRELRRWEAYVFRRWASGYLPEGRGRRALPHAWARLRRTPGSSEAWWILAKSAWLACLPRRVDTPLAERPLASPEISGGVR